MDAARDDQMIEPDLAVDECPHEETTKTGVKSGSSGVPLRGNCVGEGGGGAAFQEGVLGEPQAKLRQVNLPNCAESCERGVIRHDHHLCLVPSLEAWKAAQPSAWRC